MHKLIFQYGCHIWQYTICVFAVAFCASSVVYGPFAGKVAGSQGDAL